MNTPWTTGLHQPGVAAALGAALLFGAGTPLAKLLLTHASEIAPSVALRGGKAMPAVWLSSMRRVTGCAGAEPSAGECFKAGFESNNAEAVAACYAEDAIIWFTGGSKAEGRDAIPAAASAP